MTGEKQMQVGLKSRQYPAEPVIGAGGVVIAGERVLLVRRGGAPLAGEWSLPGGRLELGERVEQAIAREVREETGLEVVPLRLLGTYDLIDRDEAGKIRYHYVLVNWICRAGGGELRAGDDATEVCWAERGELAKYALAGFTLNAIERAFAMAEEQA
jgi:ADP-ribose pyrophosphatase YjhB (NUDIX family)